MVQLQIRGLFFATVLFAAISSTSASDDCASGYFDAVTRTSDGNTYAFRDTFVFKLNDNSVSGYPKPIVDVFPGIPSNLDAAVYWSNGKTYFFKGERYWRTSGTSPSDGYPKKINGNWPGLPNDIDAAVIWGGDNKGYFFKGTKYWRYNPGNDTTEKSNLDINTNWQGYGQDSVDAALQWSNGRTYLFKGEEYWRCKNDEKRVDSGYPMSTTKEWMGCPDEECVPESCDCVSGSFDAITRTSDGYTYAFRDTIVFKLNDIDREIASGYPKPIVNVFPGIPSNLDAAIYWNNGKTYFFKGDRYWRTSGIYLDSGYPKQIGEHWPGLPNDIDAAVIWGGDNKGYFFKGRKYWRYNPGDKTEQGNLDINTHWSGYGQGTVGAALQWSNGRTYLFNGEEYWRYNDDAERIDCGYPLSNTKEWLGCHRGTVTMP